MIGFSPSGLVRKFVFLLYVSISSPLLSFPSFEMGWRRDHELLENSPTPSHPPRCFFSHLRVTKRYLSQDMHHFSTAPKLTCFHFLLWSNWVENMCFGLLRSCVLRQIPFCVPRWEKCHLGGCDGVGGFCNCWWSCLDPISKLGNDEGGEEIDT